MESASPQDNGERWLCRECCCLVLPQTWSLHTSRRCEQDYSRQYHLIFKLNRTQNILGDGAPLCDSPAQELNTYFPATDSRASTGETITYANSRYGQAQKRAAQGDTTA